MENEILSPYLDWDVDTVCAWVSNLALSKDYRDIFWDRQITGSTLVELDREELEGMGIVDSADRLKILQHITSMKGDLMTSGKASPTKRRRFFSTAGASRCINGETRWPIHRENGVQSSTGEGQVTAHRASRNPSPSKYVNILIRDSCPQTPDSVTLSMGGDSQGVLSADSQGCLSVGHTTSSESRDSSRASSPGNNSKILFRDTPATASSHSIISSTGSRGELRSLSKLQSMATLRAHNVKRLSRSLNNLFPEGEDIFSLYQKSVAEEEEDEGDIYHSSSNRLVEILREENASLKQELETYYQRVRKLQKIEQEVEHIREAHRLLEAGTVRRAGLEKALRSKLEEEVRRLKEETISLKAEVRGRKDSGGNLSDEKKAPKREIRRRDTMITRLIKQNKDAALAREQLEKDLQLAKSQLEQQIQENRRITSRTSGSDLASGHASQDPETERQIAQVYSDSIEKLRGVLSAMQEMSQKREKLEKKLRSQLEGEIRRLKGGVALYPQHNMECDDLKKTVTELQTRNTSLAADSVRWEQKCLEVTAEKQMAYETAVIPRDARIASLERLLAEKIDSLHDAQHQKASYMSQLTEAKRQMSELEIRLASAQSSLQEKDSVIQMMQSSFLEPDDEKGSLTPPQNGVHLPRGNPNETHTVTYQPIADAVPSPSSPVKAMLGKPSSISPLPLHGAGSRSPRSLSKQTTVPPPTYNVNSSPKHRSQSASPVKSITITNTRHQWPGGNGGATATSNSLSSREPAAPNRRNGYTTHSLCSGGNKFMSPSSPPSHVNGSTNFRGSPHHHHKPRISNPNIRLLHVPATSTDHLSYRQGHSYNAQRKANTGPSAMRRSNYQRPPSPRIVKSKTPPPDYHLVSSGRKNSNPKEMSVKQRHKSVDDILSSGNQQLHVINGKVIDGGSLYDLRNTNGVGDMALPVSGVMRTGFGGSALLSRVSNSMDYLGSHHHSSSATSHEYPYILAPS